jgi:hemolysin activation/secretion protein
VKHLRLGEKARNSYDATLTFGTTLFGADEDAPGIGSDIPRAQFVKINAGWQRQGALGQAGTLVTDLRAQWSPHTLYGSEQLSLGSYSTVRGYEASVASGDMGIYMRNDLYLTPNIWNFLPEETAAKVANKTQTHLFLDMGITRDHARGVTEKAAGFGLGLSYYHKRFTLSGTLGVPLIEDNSFGIGDPVIQVRMDVKTW